MLCCRRPRCDALGSIGEHRGAACAVVLSCIARDKASILASFFCGSLVMPLKSIECSISRRKASHRIAKASDAAPSCHASRGESIKPRASHRMLALSRASSTSIGAKPKHQADESIAKHPLSLAKHRCFAVEMRCEMLRKHRRADESSSRYKKKEKKKFFFCA